MSRKRVTLRNCVCDTGDGPVAAGDLAGLNDVVVNIHEPSRPSSGTTPKKKARKPRSKGKGAFCVTSHKGKTVHCYLDRETAERVADSFTKRGRSGSEFHVQER